MSMALVAFVGLLRKRIVATLARIITLTASPVSSLHYQEPGLVKKPDDLDTVFYGGLPAILWKNVLQAFAGRGLIDLAAGTGEGCKAAMSLRKPCLGVCLSEAHVRHLFDHLVDWMLSGMEDQKGVFYNQAYKSFKTTKPDAEEKTPLPKPKSSSPPPNPRKRSRSKDKKDKPKKSKKGKRDASSSSSSD
jgi:hypothetical protein